MIFFKLELSFNGFEATKKNICTKDTQNILQYFLYKVYLISNHLDIIINMLEKIEDCLFNMQDRRNDRSNN